MDKMSQVTPYVIDVNAPLVLRMPITKLMEGDNGANTLRVQMMDGEAAANLSGYTAVGEVRREDGKRVTFACTISGNVITGTLNADCYAYPGECVATIQLAKTDGFRRTVLMIGGTVMDKGDGEIIDGGEVIEDVAGVIAMLDEMRAVKDDTKAAAQTALSSAAQADAAREGIEGEIGSLKDTKAPGIEVGASGALVTVDDAAALHAASLISHIEPVQAGEGDPSPENVRPISGWDAANAYRTGKNLFAINAVEKTLNGMTIKGDGNGRFAMSGTMETGGYTINHNLTKPVKILRGLKLVVLNANAYGQVGVFETGAEALVLTPSLDANKSIVIDLTPYAGRTINIVKYWATGGHTYSGNLDIMLTYSDDTTFEPHQGQTLTADLPETVYGGILDWKTGMLTKYSRVVYDGVTAGRMMTVTDEPVVNYAYPYAYATNFRTQNDGALAVNRLKIVKDGRVDEEGIVVSTVISVKLSRESIGWEQGDTTTDIIDKINAVLHQWYLDGEPLEVVYIPNDPTTIQLTPQQLGMLKGYNNVWSDCGDTDLVYIADTKMYIDSKISDLVTLALANQ